MTCANTLVFGYSICNNDKRGFSVLSVPALLLPWETVNLIKFSKPITSSPTGNTSTCNSFYSTTAGKRSLTGSFWTKNHINIVWYPIIRHVLTAHTSTASTFSPPHPPCAEPDEFPTHHTHPPVSPQFLLRRCENTRHNALTVGNRKTSLCRVQAFIALTDSVIGKHGQRVTNTWVGFETVVTQAEQFSLLTFLGIWRRSSHRTAHSTSKFHKISQLKGSNPRHTFLRNKCSCILKTYWKHNVPS